MKFNQQMTGVLWKSEGFWCGNVMLARRGAAVNGLLLLRRGIK